MTPVQQANKISNHSDCSHHCSISNPTINIEYYKRLSGLSDPTPSCADR